MTKLLNSLVQLNPRFQRSVRVDADLGRIDALDGFVLQPSAALMLESMARHICRTQQRAFTWTGPYGAGKSSLALTVCSLVHTDPKVQHAARRALNLERGGEVLDAFGINKGKNWLVLPLVGKNAAVDSEVSRILAETDKRTVKGADIVARLVALSESGRYSGVLLLLDEFGKFLDFAARSNGDIHFFQELAEAACRSKGKLVVVGVLHQSFDQYASQLGREIQEEWSKVQGRYLDLPLAASSDETVDLIGKALNSLPPRNAGIDDVSTRVADSIAKRRPGVTSGLSGKLKRCWPLHPVTAALLGPTAKRRFGQNERSIFGFLNSMEAGGFREFLNSTEAGQQVFFNPWQYWDYLRINLEPAILSSPDGHRWSSSLDALERAESKGSLLHVQVLKTIAVIEMFRNGSGVVADQELLSACFPKEDARALKAALSDLDKWSVVINRKHLDAWAIYAGSDFDIEAAVRKARVEVESVGLKEVLEVAELPPVLAKRVYQETGTMRFLSRAIRNIDDARHYVQQYRKTIGTCGEFLLLLPRFGDSRIQSARATAKDLSGVTKEMVIGVPRQGPRMVELGRELLALRHVYQTSPELEHDRVAARELLARMSTLEVQLEESLRDAFFNAVWYRDGAPMEAAGTSGLSGLASIFAEGKFPHTPILKSELLNREAPSSNSVKARRDLIHRMLEHNGEASLGYASYPPDAGIYYSLLKATTIHREERGVWGFYAPVPKGYGTSLRHLWSQLDTRLLVEGNRTTLQDFYRICAEPPFGVKAGVLPVLATAYFMANRTRIALYHDGVFTPEFTAFQADEWLQDPSRIEWRFISVDKVQLKMLADLSSRLSNDLSRRITPEPLDTARALVASVINLPDWTKRTACLSETTKAIRHVLLRASDPHRTLFVDLPALLDGATNVSATIADCFHEMAISYPNMLKDMELKLFTLLNHDGAPDLLRKRGSTVSGIAGDFRLEAFAGRIANYGGSDEEIEGLISLAVNKPPREWADKDLDSALIQIGTWSQDFRRIEALAPIKGRSATRRTFAVVFGLGDGNKTVSLSFDVAERERSRIDDLVNEICSRLSGTKMRREVLLAAIAETGARLVAEVGESQ